MDTLLTQTGTLIFHEQSAFDDGTFIDARIWQLIDLDQDAITVRYCLEYHSATALILSYDNSDGQHRRHCRGETGRYGYQNVNALVSDFLIDVMHQRRPT